MINIFRPTSGADELAAVGQEYLDAFVVAGCAAWHLASPLSKRGRYVGVRERTDRRER